MQYAYIHFSIVVNKKRMRSVACLTAFQIHISHNMHNIVNKNAALSESDNKKGGLYTVQHSYECSNNSKSSRNLAAE